MDNAEKLVTLGTQEEGNQSKNTTQYVLDTIILSKTRTLIETTGGKDEPKEVVKNITNPKTRPYKKHIKPKQKK
jgi:hypothetical protein